MAWGTPTTVVTGTVILTSWGNGVRDNFNETAPAKVTTQGDTVYATGANALARLAKGTALQIYRMNSGATAPEWVTLTAALVTAGTFPSGAFLFVGNLTVDTTTLFVDATNHVVGVGTTTITNAKFQVAGGIRYTGAVTGDLASSGAVDWATDGARFFSWGVSGSTKGTFTWIAKGADGSSNIPLVIDNGGKVGVGMTPAYLFDVGGQARAQGFVTNIVTLANNAVAQLCQTATPDGMVSIRVQGSSNYALYEVTGALNTTVELLDTFGQFGAAAGASTYNVYWSAGNSRFEIENKSGGNRTFIISLMGAP